MEIPAFLAGFSTIDICLGVIILYCALRGLLRGFIAELMGLIGIILGFALAGNPQIHHEAVQLLSNIINAPDLVPLISYVGVFAVAMFVLRLFARLLSSVLAKLGGGNLNKFFGLFAGAVKGVILCTLILLCLHYLMPDQNLHGSSELVPYINKFWTWVSDVTGGAHRIPQFSF